MQLSLLLRKLEEGGLFMKIRSLLIGLGAMVLAAFPACAETITTGDGVISIETPDATWVQTVDPNYWFVISNGKNTITIDHLSNGETLPNVDVAGSGYEAVYQAFLSTRNEVFVVKGLAASQAEMASLMQTIGSIKILKYDTKTAIVKETEASVSQFGLRTIGKEYYVITDELNVRNGCSTDEAQIGTLRYGEKVTVNGAVTKDGADYGWYQIQFNGAPAYVSASFLSETAPAAQSSSAAQSSEKKIIGDGFDVYREDGTYVGYMVPYSDGRYYIQDGMIPFNDNGDGSYFGGAGAGITVYPYASLERIRSNNGAGNEQVQCEYCGEWFNAGNDYRNHVMAAHNNPEADVDEPASDRVQCEYCGEWFEAGNDYRNHVMAAHNNDTENSDTGEEASAEEPASDMVQCEYCGEWFAAGNDYRNHVMAAHNNNDTENNDTGEEASAEEQPASDMVQCEYCGEWFAAGNDYRNHVMAAHSDQSGE